MFCHRYFILMLVKSCCDTENLANAASWPTGEYSLPKPITGCPDDSWKEGWLRQEMENDDINDTVNVKSRFSSNFHMNASIVNGTEGGQYEFVDREFCTENLTFRNKTSWKYWPKGMYCIYQKNNCQYDMDGGWIKFDDEDNFDGVNRNKHAGILPIFSRRVSTVGATTLFYCCQTKGKWYNPVELPTKKPFYLLPYKTPNCQRVRWTISSLEYIVYDTENELNSDKFFGHHVYTDKVRSLPKIFYCYYAGCRYKFHGNTGSFKSPNLNNSFSDFHSCSWAINVDLTKKISLRFKQLNLLDCEHNYLEIYAGQTENSSMLLAVYCGRNATSGAQMISTTNELFIVMKHRQTNSSSTRDIGFYADYITFANIKNLKPTMKKHTPSSSSYVTNGTFKSEEESSLDGGKKGKLLLNILISILALVFILVLGVVFCIYFIKRKQHAGLQKEVADMNTLNNKMYKNPNSLTSKQVQSGDDDVNSKETSNPIYASKFSDGYSTINDLELFNANENILYEPGNPQERSLQIVNDDS